MSEFLNSAISAHLSWKGQLRRAMESPTSLNVAEAESDCLCSLGKWLQGTKGKERDSSEFKSLVASHATFHKAAGRVARLIQAGKQQEATAALEGGEFATASKETVKAIMALKTKLAAA
ncbi:CZB domain-containing protein [Roseicella aquatilis]|nr:CZB domain-containing protein [Roseicella aquatilis]